MGDEIRLTDASAFSDVALTAIVIRFFGRIIIFTLAFFLVIP